MTKKHIFRLLSILLLLSWLACAYDNDTAGQEIVSMVTKPPAVPTWSVDETSAPASSDTSQTITLPPAVPTWSVYETSAPASSDSEGSSSQTITLKNPTFQELKDFILRDPTNRNKVVPNQYECRHFATEVNNNAEAEGLRCAFVLLCYDQGQHAVVAFDTTDTGLVYIEPQTDARLHPEVGGEYQGKEIKEILIAW